MNFKPGDWVLRDSDLDNSNWVLSGGTFEPYEVETVREQTGQITLKGLPKSWISYFFSPTFPSSIKPLEDYM